MTIYYRKDIVKIRYIYILKLTFYLTFEVLGDKKAPVKTGAQIASMRVLFFFCHKCAFVTIKVN
jgi:hypothetical protein